MKLCSIKIWRPLLKKRKIKNISYNKMKSNIVYIYKISPQEDFTTVRRKLEAVGPLIKFQPFNDFKGYSWMVIVGFASKSDKDRLLQNRENSGIRDAQIFGEAICMQCYQNYNQYYQYTKCPCAGNHGESTSYYSLKKKKNQQSGNNVFQAQRQILQIRPSPFLDIKLPSCNNTRLFGMGQIRSPNQTTQPSKKYVAKKQTNDSTAFSAFQQSLFTQESPFRNVGSVINLFSNENPNLSILSSSAPPRQTEKNVNKKQQAKKQVSNSIFTQASSNFSFSQPSIFVKPTNLSPSKDKKGAGNQRKTQGCLVFYYGNQKRQINLSVLQGITGIRSQLIDKVQLVKASSQAQQKRQQLIEDKKQQLIQDISIINPRQEEKKEQNEDDKFDLSSEEEASNLWEKQSQFQRVVRELDQMHLEEKKKRSSDIIDNPERAQSPGQKKVEQSEEKVGQQKKIRRQI